MTCRAWESKISENCCSLLLLSHRRSISRVFRSAFSAVSLLFFLLPVSCIPCHAVSFYYGNICTSFRCTPHCLSPALVLTPYDTLAVMTRALCIMRWPRRTLCIPDLSRVRSREQNLVLSPCREQGGLGSWDEESPVECESRSFREMHSASASASFVRRRHVQ